MKKWITPILALFAALTSVPVTAQWQVPANSIPVGKGAGTGFGAAAPGTAGNILFSNGAAAAPSFGSTSSLFDSALCSTTNAVPVRGASAWQCSTVAGSLAKIGSQGYVAAGNYAGAITNTSIFAARGTLASPITDQSAVAVFQSVGNQTTDPGGTTLYASYGKRASTANVGGRSIFAESIDSAGGAGSYVEGARFSSTITSGAGAGGNTIGVVGIGVGSNAFEYAFGMEALVYNDSGAAATTTFSSSKISAAVNLNCGQGAGLKCDAGALTSPFVFAKFITGFYVAAASVEDAAFRNDASLVYGVDLDRGTYSGAGIVTPSMIGGKAAASNLTLKATSGVGGGSEYIALQVGNNGVIEVARAVQTAVNSESFVVGSTTAQLNSGGANYPKIQSHAVSAVSPFGVFRWTADANGPQNQFLKSRGATIGTHTIVQSGDGLGLFAFAGSDGTAFRTAVRIQAVVDGTPGASDMPGRMLLETSPDGSATPLARMIIFNDGGVNIGASSAVAATTTSPGSGVFKHEGTTASTSSTTGIVQIAGGLGVAGAAWVGTYLATTPVAVGSLPACGAGTKSARMFVTDSNAVSFTAGIGAVVAAGGTTNVPVVCDGTNWRIGANDNIPDNLMRKYA